MDGYKYGWMDRYWMMDGLMMYVWIWMMDECWMMDVDIG